MLKRSALFFVAAAVLTLSACGGGGKGGAPLLPTAPAPTASSGGQQSTGKSRATFVVTVPKTTPAPLGAKRPAYVSPATQSMSVSVSQGSTSVVKETVGLTATSTGCTSSLANVSCSLSLTLSPGTYTASITTYDGANATGNQLSTAQAVSFTVVANQNNIVPLSLSGIPASIVALAGPTTDSVYVVAQDADGNFIVGSGAPTFTAAKASSSEPTVATITQPTSTAPNTIVFSSPSTPVDGTETVTVTAGYPSGQTNGCPSTAACTLTTPITVTYSAGTAFTPNYEYNNVVGFSLPLSNDNQSAAYTFSGATEYPYWGIALSSKGTVFGWGYEPGSALVVSSPPYTNTIVDTNTGITGADYYGAADASGDVFIPNYPTSSGAIAIVKSPYTGAATQLTAGVDDPYGAAVDANNNLYVANEGNETVTVYASPYTTVASTVATTTIPYGVVVSGSKLYVTEDGAIDVFTLPVSSSSTPVATLSMDGYSYGAAAVDSKGNLWVACYEGCATGVNGAVYEFTTPFSTGETPSVSITSMPDGSATACSYALGIGFDGLGNLYVDDGYGGTYDGCLLEYSGTITSSSVPTNYVNSSTLYYPWGMVIAPGGITVTP